MLTALLCGLAPALHAVRGDLEGRLREAGQGLNTGPWRVRLRGGLVIAEVAISIVLLAGAGLMLRTFFALEHVDVGFNPEAIVHAQLVLPQNEDNSAIREKAVLQKILEQVKMLPGVNAASIVAGLPPYGGPNDSMIVAGQTFSAPRYVMFNLCSAGYFATLQLPLIRGRRFTQADIASARLVAVINRTLASQFFGKGDPLGQEIKFTLLDRFRDAPHNAFFKVIGVVGDTKNDGPQGRVHPEAFLPYTITAVGPRNLLVRTGLGRPGSLLPSLQRAIWSVAPGVALTNTGTIETLLSDSAYAQPRFGLFTLAVFACLGLVLVAVGVFSVISYSVSLRTHEIGIRMALGAQRSTILLRVLLKGLRLVLIGVIIGEAASVALTRLMASQIWGVSTVDPLTLGGVAALIVIVGVLACLLPARRATRIDPMVALRHE